MSLNPYQVHLEHAQAVIHQYHRDAVHAEQLRLVRTRRSGHLAAGTVSLWASVRSLVRGAGQQASQKPIAHPELV